MKRNLKILTQDNDSRGLGSFAGAHSELYSEHHVSSTHSQVIMMDAGSVGWSSFYGKLLASLCACGAQLGGKVIIALEIN